MRRSFQRRARLLLALGIMAALPPLAAEASAPDAALTEEAVAPSAPVAATTTGLAGELLHTATDAFASITGTLDTAVRSLAGAVTPAEVPCGGSGGLTYGKDGRITILLLGSDYRTQHYIGERMDVIIVATLKANGRIAMASIPRDMVFFPKAGGGTSGTHRINTMYYSYRRHIRYDRVDCSALKRFTNDVASALKTEIDYYALVRMREFIQLVNHVGYVPTDIPGPIIDTVYGHHGLYFPKAKGYHLKGEDRCHPRPFLCRSAIGYVRSRHGTQAGGANNDFKRAYRQHAFIFDAAQRVRARGTGPNLTNILVAIINKVWTNIPKNLTVAKQIYNLLGGTSLLDNDQVVFGPARYAFSNRTTPRYAFRPHLARMRTWINLHFGS